MNGATVRALTVLWVLPAAALGQQPGDADVTPAAGEGIAASGDSFCWYAQSVKGCRRGCPLTPFECRPILDLPCRSMSDCPKKITELRACDRDQKGCKGIRKRCGCDDPGPAACCLEDGGCEDLPFGECADRGGVWSFGEDCQSIRARVKKFKAKCSGRGTVSITVKFSDDSRDGQTLTVGIGERIRFEIEVHGKTARRSLCCFEGEQTVRLLDPQLCEMKKVNCQ